MTTYHKADGKFSGRDGAHFAVRDGERLKVVRQLRRTMKAKKTESANDLVQRLNVAKQKAALLGQLSAPGYVNVADYVKD